MPQANIFYNKKNRVDSTYKISLTDLKKLPNVAVYALKPEWYMTILPLFYILSYCAIAFAKAAFPVLYCSSSIAYSKVSTLKRPIGFRTPGNTTQSCMVATKSGPHSCKFTPVFNAILCLLQVFNTSASVSEKNISVRSDFWAEPNTKYLYWMSKKNILMLEGLIDMFSPQQGTVIGLYAMTTALELARLGNYR